MQDTLFTQLILPVSLGIVMLGLGLSLSLEDFKRVVKYPKALSVALLCQMVLLPVICFSLVRLSGLHSGIAVGMMLLAASPGGATSNLYSHLAKGDVALNISLTAVNSVLSLFMLPFIVNLSLDYFMDSGQFLPMQFKKVMEVFAIVLVPVAIGMFIKKLRPGFASSIHKPVKIASSLIIVLIIVMLVFMEWQVLVENFGKLGLPLLFFNVLSMSVGYFIPRFMNIKKKQAISISLEIGIHNGTFAIYIALTVLQNSAMSIPPALYSLIMFFTAAVFGYWVSRKNS